MPLTDVMVRNAKAAKKSVKLFDAYGSVFSYISRSGRMSFMLGEIEVPQMVATV